MKKVFKTIGLAVCAISLSGALTAQDLPKPSSFSKIEQRVGLTDFTVEYSRPSVKERVIFGELVSYGKVWRTGANKATIITISDDVTINGQAVKAGSYSVFTIPGKDVWKIMLNSNTEQWGSYDYDSKDDVLAVEVKPEVVTAVETFTVSFDHVIGDDAKLSFAWETTKVSLDVKVDTETKAWANIEKAIGEAEADKKFIVLRNGANYCVELNKKLDQAKVWIDESVKLNEYWYSYWVRAEVYAASGDKKEAINSAEKAIELGQKKYDEEEKEFTYKKNLEELIEGWKK